MTERETLCECRDLWGNRYAGKGTQVVDQACPVHGRPSTYERVFGAELLVSFAAATVEEAEQRVKEIAAAVLDIEAVWEVEAEFNPEQKAETVDV